MSSDRSSTRLRATRLWRTESRSVATLKRGPAEEPPLTASPAPLQFRLRTLLFGVALCCLLFGVLSNVGTVGAVVVLLLVVLVIAHVAAAAINRRVLANSRAVFRAEQTRTSLVGRRPASVTTTGNRLATPASTPTAVSQPPTRNP